jgi:hypothetical protein
MKAYFIIFTACLFVFSTAAQTTSVRMNTNNDKWKQVDEMDKQSLPQSALAIVDQIRQDAIKQGNSPELIKAMIYQLKYKTAINQDQLPGQIVELEKWILSDKNPIEQATLYSIVAELYANYYSAYSNQINQRTAITGYTPDDIREWSANLFIQRIAGYVRLSFVPVNELQKKDALDYRAILTEGESSRSLRPTLYDFLVYRGIELYNRLATNFNTQNYFPQTQLSDKENFAPVESFVKHAIQANDSDFVPQILKLYQDLLNFRLRQNNPEALVIADLDRLEFVSKNTQIENLDNLYLDALQQLENRYAGNDFCVEIGYKKATFLYSQSGIRVAYALPESAPESAVLQKEKLQQVHTICLEGIKKYPDYKRIGILRNLLQTITLKDLSSNTGNVVYPGNSMDINLRYRNINRLIVQIYKINEPTLVYVNWAEAGQYKKSGKLVQTKEINLKNDYPYCFYDTIVKIPINELGNYEYVIYEESISEKEPPINKQFSVSRLASVTKTVDGQMELLITDRLSGKPVEGATVSFYQRKNNRFELISGKTATTDKLGLALCPADNNQFYKVSYGNDTSLILSPTPWIYNQTQQNKTYTNLQLFTDRSIYRPGQTVYFKGIAYETNKNEVQTVPNKKYTIALRDANFKEISNQTVTTNSFGSFAGEFQLPQGLLNGQFSIRSDVDNASISFRVEEYKRPAFDIQFNKNDKTFRLGDKVTVEGNAKTFSGVAVSNTVLSYRVTRQPHWLYRWAWSAPVQVAEGTVQTGDDGKFEIAFTAGRAFEDRERKNVSYTYIVEASLTDANGETQQSKTNVNIGDKSGYLDVTGLNETVNKDSLSGFTVRAVNLNGTPVQAKGNYELYRLKPKDATKLDAPSDEWIPDKKVASGDFEAGKEINNLTFKSLASGRYRIIVNANDIMEKQMDFTLASMQDRQPPAPVYQWLMTSKTTCAVGENTEIIYGSSAKEVYVLYEIFRQNGKRASISRFILNNENKKLTIPFLEDYGDGYTVYFTFIKDNQVFTRQIAIYKKQLDKNLTLKMEVFRDRLLPGQQEEWKISVKDAAQNPVLAELLAVMYDASLDKIQNHSWAFNPVPNIYLSFPSINNGKEFDRTYAAFAGKMTDYSTIPAFVFDRLNWFGWSIYDQTIRIKGIGSPVMRSAAPAAAPVLAPDRNVLNGDENEAVVVGYGVQKKLDETGAVLSTNSASQPAQPEVQIRQNFAETAFFYPQLKTNEAGETLISFTVPESNTTWKLMGLAHTKDLKFGQIIEQVISQKQLMIRPNIPRFIREGDRVTISTNISNLSEKDITGTVQIECFDPVTEKTNILIPENEKPFRLDAGKTTTVSWTFQTPSGIDLTALKIVARSPEFSDGEQHLIPVLPNRMLVTESLPLTIRGGQTRRVTFDAMNQTNSPGRENYRLTLEFTSNPVWYAVQALPAMITPASDNVLSWFAACYSNTLAVSIANSTPKIKSIIDVWTKQGGTKETLLSQLEKNQELKAVLLEETPWVLEAQSETEQRQRLSLLFDINRNSNLNAQAIEKLKLLQTEEGGWTWFKGMPASVSITQWLLYGMEELSRRNVGNYTNEIKFMQGKAIRFIDDRFRKHYDDYKKYNSGKKPESISTYELEYLLVRSMYKDIPLEKTEDAFRFYLDLAGQYWNKTNSLYDRAIAALVLQRNGNTKTALDIVKSLREHASHTPDEGMFWANNQAQSFFFQSATTIHTFMMQAFRETGSKPEEMDEMKLWLLKQKQTQQWESTPATVNAVNILLQTGSNWLQSNGKVSIQIGNQTIDTEKGEAGTGYIKTTFDAKSITPDMNRITISKEGAGPGWGAVYGQYFEDLDKITAAKTGLNVEKALFIEKVTTTGKTLLPITEKQPLAVGDKVIVRLVVRADRDFEYVLLKDLRASCFEPAESLSGIRWAQQAIYYQMIRDASMNFYFYNLPKGTHVFEYPLYANASGDYSNGIATIQCLYAPEFVSHTQGGRVKVTNN